MINQMRPSTNWSPMPGPQPPRRSAWPWIIGIVAILGVMGVGVVILVVALAAMNANRNSNIRLANRNTNQWNANVNPTRPAFNDDFSAQNWRTGTYPYGSAWYKDGEYHLRAIKGGYMIIYGPNNNYQTDNSTVRVTTRNVEGASTIGGHGLVIHSSQWKDGKTVENYAFLIRTGDAPSYQVVHHVGGNKDALREWTRSPFIRGGSSTNQLEVVARESQLTFSVNGHVMTSVTAVPGSAKGMAGFYSSGGSDVAFDDLVIAR
ncbi:MAG: hypothetical protein QOD75_2017 [Blastocatellia bacterium]|nr:hypothetical protein [Blastocatellia bacterium]